jgi:hypothetical protein
MDRFPSVMADGVRLKWIPGINTISLPSNGGVFDSLVSGSFSMSACTPGSSATFQTQNHSNTLVNAFANEASRFGSACFETLLEKHPTVGAERSLGWPLIRSYYAAFFAAHALLRICGESLIYATTLNANKLNQLGQIYLGVQPQFTKGLCHVKASPNGQGLQIVQVKGGGGSHEELWKYFHAFLVDVENNLASNFAALPEAILAIQTSQVMRSGLSRNNCSNGTWLSQSRNSINYQQEYGVWFPYKIRRKEASAVMSTFDHWKDEQADWAVRFSTVDPPLIHSHLSQAVGAILTCALKDIVKRNTSKGKSFVERLPFALIRQRLPGW